MTDMALYLALAAVGFVIGARMRDKKDKLFWTGRVQTVAIIIVVLAMGSRMGANQEVTGNLSSIGLYSLAFTAIIALCTTAGLSLCRRLMGFDRNGLRRAAGRQAKAVESTNMPQASAALEGAAPGASAGEAAQESKGLDRMTLIIIACVAIGMVFGFFFGNRIFESPESFDQAGAWAITIGLCLLLVFVGLDLGLDANLGKNMRQAGLRVLAFPAVNVVGSLGAAALCTLFVPLTLRENLAVGAGMGWYSMAPGLIMDAGHVTASAICFMTNVLREITGFVLIPTIARKIGAVECIGIPGAAAMDVCLPLVERSTNGNVAVYSFVSGVILSLAVPVLVPLVLG